MTAARAFPGTLLFFFFASCLPAAAPAEIAFPRGRHVKERLLIGKIDRNQKTVVKYHPVDLFPKIKMKIHRFCRQICLFRFFYRNQSGYFFFADKTAAITASMVGLCFYLSDLTTDPGKSANMTTARVYNRKPRAIDAGLTFLVPDSS